ncbi:MAG: exopolysaccharide biosynthesis protein [Desulfobacterales bacterium]
MNTDLEQTNLEQLIDQIDRTAEDKDRVTLSAVIEAIGHRSFGPLLLMAGLVILAPIIGDIPGIPTIMGVLVFLSAGQLLFRRSHFWLPSWLLNRSVARNKLRRSLQRLRPVGRFIDRFSRPRLSALTRGAGLYITALACLLVAVVIPVMELIPFSANLAGSALTIFGLSLIARDGLLALFALMFTATALGTAFYHLL